MGSFTFVYRMFFVFLSCKNHDHLKKGSFKSMQSFFLPSWGIMSVKQLDPRSPNSTFFMGGLSRHHARQAGRCPEAWSYHLGMTFCNPLCLPHDMNHYINIYIYISTYIYAYIYMAYRWVIGSKPLTIPGMHIQVYRANCVANSEHGINWFPATCGQE